jgi:hypothetical protein
MNALEQSSHAVEDPTEAVRGLVAVDKAVRDFRRGVIRPVHVTPEVAEQLGWGLCGCGQGGVRPGALVIYRGVEWHVECALTVARAAA